VIRAAVRHAFTEAWSITRSAPIQTVVAVGLTALALFVPGLLLLIAHNVSRFAAAAEEPVAVVATLAPGADARPAARILAAAPGVGRVMIVWPSAARERFGRTFPELRHALAQIPEIEFPTTIEVSLSRSARERDASEIARRARAISDVAEVEEETQIEARFRALRSLVRNGAIALGGVLVAAAVLSVISAVRLALDQHRDEIEIMRLMGATETAIRAPFWLQGMLEGAAGGLVALVLLAGAHRAGLSALGAVPHPVLAMLWAGFLPPVQWAGFPAAGAVSGLLGALLAVRRERASSGG